MESYLDHSDLTQLFTELSLQWTFVGSDSNVAGVTKNQSGRTYGELQLPSVRSSSQKSPAFFLSEAISLCKAAKEPSIFRNIVEKRIKHWREETHKQNFLLHGRKNIVAVESPVAIEE